MERIHQKGCFRRFEAISSCLASFPFAAMPMIVYKYGHFRCLNLIQDKSMCRDNRPSLNAHCYPDNCRPGSMRGVTCRGNQKIQAVNLPSAVVADLLHKFNGPSGSQSFSAARAGMNLCFRRSARLPQSAGKFKAAYHH
jgi:hypothetical protein